MKALRHLLLVKRLQYERAFRGQIRQRTEAEVSDQRSEVTEQAAQTRNSKLENRQFHVALLTGGGDKPYALGIAEALTSVGISVDFIGSDDLNVPELLGNSRIQFRNLRGDQRPGASPIAKALRVLKYYARLIIYAATARPKLFHILWNNKFQLFDCTLLMLLLQTAGQTRGIYGPQR